MIDVKKDACLAGTDFPFGAVVVHYPADKPLCSEQFYALAEKEIAAVRAVCDGYDRKAMWGENPHYRFFKKFKKTYPVMLQYESAILKDRPFPRYNPVSEVAFLAEITTGVLSGAHDTDYIKGVVNLFLSADRTDFVGLRGETVHTYPNDFCARDDEGIIFSLVAGADLRTCAKSDTKNALYPLFGTPDLSVTVLENAAQKLTEYIKVLCPKAEIEIKMF